MIKNRTVARTFLKSTAALALGGSGAAKMREKRCEATAQLPAEKMPAKSPQKLNSSK
jgi:hypothetical protein